MANPGHDVYISLIRLASTSNIELERVGCGSGDSWFMPAMLDISRLSAVSSVLLCSMYSLSVISVIRIPVRSCSATLLAVINFCPVKS